MFSLNRGTHVLSTTPASTADSAPLFWVASVNNETNVVFLKVDMLGVSMSGITTNINLGIECRNR